jgi:hypothetical protein
MGFIDPAMIKSVGKHVSTFIKSPEQFVSNSNYLNDSGMNSNNINSQVHSTNNVNSTSNTDTNSVSSNHVLPYQRNDDNAEFTLMKRAENKGESGVLWVQLTKSNRLRKHKNQLRYGQSSSHSKDSSIHQDGGHNGGYNSNNNGNVNTNNRDGSESAAVVVAPKFRPPVSFVTSASEGSQNYFALLPSIPNSDSLSSSNPQDISEKSQDISGGEDTFQSILHLSQAQLDRIADLKARYFAQQAMLSSSSSSSSSSLQTKPKAKERDEYDYDPGTIEQDRENALYQSKVDAGVVKGVQLLRNIGWEAGKGLGKSEQGVHDFVRVTVRQDRLGLGYKMF